jgi:hypothetical protein
MKRRSAFGAFAVSVAACLTLTASARASKDAFVSVPLIVSLRDLATDGILSDGGTYTDGLQNVRAALVANTNGNLVFDTNDGSGDGGRRLFLNFQGQPTGTPLPSAVAFPIDVFLGTLPVVTNATDNLQIMSAGQTLQRRARWAWVDGAFQYSVRWDGPENGHSFLNVHCDADDGAVGPTHCTRWTVTPGGIAGLYSIPAKGREIDTYYAAVTMPFSMTLLKK